MSSTTSRGASIKTTLFGLALLVLLIALFVTSCAKPNKPASTEAPVGQGTTIADQVSSALAPQVGEPFIPPDLDDTNDTRVYLLERVLNTAEQKPEWAIVDQPNTSSMIKDSATHPGKVERAEKFVFADRSALVLIGIPIGSEGSGQGLQLDRVEIERP